VFIAGETPLEAIPQLNRLLANGQYFTVDLLGEYSLSEHEALLYLKRYLEVVSTLHKHLLPVSRSNLTNGSSVCISVKLSALYSQIDSLNFESSVNILSERLSQIARAVEQVSGTLYVDAEDSKYNPIVYETFKRVFGSEEFKLASHPGIVVQAYSKDALEIANDLLRFAANRRAPIAIRLVKGAYWDSEQVVASQNNWSCPLFTVKEHSDANFEELSRLLLNNTALCRPAFASHNIRSLTHACCYAERNGIGNDKFEIQVLYGMADAIATTFSHRGYQTRFYAPIGKLIPGMGYLVRRLLENSSNESFIRQTFFEPTAIEKLLAKPAPIRCPQLAHNVETESESELTLSFHY
jgi:RHH-type proline utilization regulon transcriptional repressor/proline dehydrogenase/delta 1-pyrroline-5-carboxylate dehydrogenase